MSHIVTTFASHVRSQHCHKQLRTRGDLNIQDRLHSPLATDHIALPQLLCVMCGHFRSIFSSLHATSTSTCFIPFVLHEPFLFLARFAPVPFQFIYYAYCALFPFTTCAFIAPLLYNLKYTSVTYLQKKRKSVPPFQVS